jgi:hypothetical protein
MKLNTLIAATLLAAAPLAPAAAQSNDWSWGITPYVWGASISTDLREDAPPVGNETDFSSIIDKIDMAFMGHVEGQGQDIGLFADVLYLSLADDAQRRFSSTESDLDAMIYELAVVWSPGEMQNRGLELFGGLRYMEVDFQTQIDPVNPLLNTWGVELDRSYADAMIGLRYRADLSDKWGYSLRADGAWGDTEGSYNASAMLLRRTGSGEWAFGYRYFDTELKVRTSSLALQLHGPAVGYSFRF